MNVVALAEELGLSLSNQKVESISSVLASRAKNSAATFAPTVREVLHGCRAEIKSILLILLGTRTQAEYGRERERLFSKYLGLSLAISHFASAVVPRDVIERLSRESICELENDFRDKGLAAFGASVRSQTLFTIWTLRRTNEVLLQIVGAKLDEAKRDEDRNTCLHFTFSAFRAQMALECLQMAMDGGIAVYPEVSEELVDDLRAMVNAYSWARQGLEIRVPSVDVGIEIPAMDDEDRQLIDAAFVNASELTEGQ
jgi:hypothetical protein